MNSIRAALLAVACALLLWPATTAFTAEDSKLTLLNQMQSRHVSIHEQVSPAVVEVQSYGDQIPASTPCYGTGVVVSADGLVLTSITAVPSVAASVKITFPNGQIHKSQMIAYDPETEIRLLRVLPLEGSVEKKFPFVDLVDSTQTHVGDLAYTAGNPFQTIGRDRVVAWSIGTVSGIYTIKSADKFARYKGLIFETDAAVNPGSDGGPLFDANGRLLGIMSLCYCESRWLGTAIPAHLIKKGGLAQHLKDVALINPSVPFKSDALEGARAARGVMEGLSISSRPAQIAMVKLIVKRPKATEPVVVRTDNDRRPLPNFNRPDAPVSGVVFDPQGYILTSAFNVEGEDVNGNCNVQITAVLSDGTHLPAMRLGRNFGQDVAVLKMTVPPGKKLNYIPLAVDPDLKLGRFVTVLGASEAGDVPTRTMGVISAFGRLDGGVVQTDALINYGNSGGAVVDLRGRLVGIASHLKLNSDWSQPNSGVGFFAQSDKIIAYMEDLKMTLDIRTPQREFPGIPALPNSSDLQGVMVKTLTPNSVASLAGLKEGDVIVAVDGMDTPNPQTLVQVLKAHGAGDTVDVAFMRAGYSKALHAPANLVVDGKK